jgi:alkaline phosphatase
MNSLKTVAILMTLLLATSIAATLPAQGRDVPSNPVLAQSSGRSIILMIGDGMGYEHLRLTGLVEYGVEGSLTMETLPWNSSVLTHSLDAEITDSAAAGTAIATGNKTNNRMVSMNPDEVPLQTILEISQLANQSTGLVSTCEIQHATPATFMVHVSSRGDYTEITSQIVEEADVDVLMRGGRSYFSSSQLDYMVADGYSIVYNRSAMMDVSSGRILGLFSNSHMIEERHRDYVTTPSLLEMTNKSIEILSQDPDGFFLMVEGGQIDFAGHDNDKVGVALETVEFDKAVALAVDYVEENSDTILIVTADHECGGLAVIGHDLSGVLPEDLSSETEKRTLRTERAQNVSTTWSSTYHTAAPVPLLCYGAAFDGLESGALIDNTAIFDLMKDYLDGVPLSIENLLDDTTNTTTSTTSTTGFSTDETPETSSDTTSTLPTPVGQNQNLLMIGALVLGVVIMVAVVVARRRF